MADAFDELRKRLPESVALALVRRLDIQREGWLSLHINRRSGEVTDAHIEPPERIPVRKARDHIDKA